MTNKSAISKLILLVLPIFLILFDAQAQDYKTVDEAKGLPIGATAPNFSAKDAHEHEFSLQNALKNGPVVIIFYRGHWCPICNKHLSKVQDSLSLISNTGASVIAISPEKPELLLEMEEKTKAEFTLLYDEGYKIAQAFDVTFLPNKSELFKYNTFLRADLEEAHSDDSQRLPIPATFIINQDGIVVWRQFDPNYMNRSSVKDILEAIKKL